MSYFIGREELERAEHEVIDEETGMTRADWIEWNYGDDIVIL